MTTDKYSDDEILALTSYARGVIEAIMFAREAKEPNVHIPFRMWHEDKPSKGLTVQFLTTREGQYEAYGYHNTAVERKDQFKIDLDPVEDDDQIPDIEIAYLTGTEGHASPFGIKVSFHGDEVETFWFANRKDCIEVYDSLKACERFIYMLMRKKHFEGHNDTYFTEREWKAKYANYEGDGTIPPSVVAVIWDDPNETPSEAIKRLNAEVLRAYK